MLVAALMAVSFLNSMPAIADDSNKSKGTIGIICRDDFGMAYEFSQPDHREGYLKCVEAHFNSQGAAIKQTPLEYLVKGLYEMKWFYNHYVGFPDDPAERR